MWRQWFRSVVVAGVVVGLGLLGVSVPEAADPKETPKKHKIMYHLTEHSVDKAKFVLGNIENHIRGVGGRQNIEALELVVHGPALKNFVTKEMDPDVRRSLDGLQAQGVAFGACGNTMKAFNITLEQLPDGTKYLPQGGVVRVMELQEQGYAYIRP